MISVYRPLWQYFLDTFKFETFRHPQSSVRSLPVSAHDWLRFQLFITLFSGILCGFLPPRFWGILQGVFLFPVFMCFLLWIYYRICLGLLKLFDVEFSHDELFQSLLRASWCLIVTHPVSHLVHKMDLIGVIGCAYLFYQFGLKPLALSKRRSFIVLSPFVFFSVLIVIL